jgi:anhydro-N-acetylmuramic acid kinase
MTLSGLDLVKLDRILGQFIGNEILQFDLQNVDAIASHGHTVFHEPHIGITHQIGSLNEIHAITSLPVIGDFRTLDVALGGQGAPLVPVGDAALFSGYDATLNFGGIANITVLGDDLKAFDLCPLNQVSNFICKKYFDCEYDKRGELGELGVIDEELLAYFNAFPFYKKAAPKSLGKENVDAYFIHEVGKSELAPTAILRTYYEHVANVISEELIKNSSQKTLCTGGGVFNEFLLELITEKIEVQNLKLIIPSKEVIEFKEAIIFAFLGLLRGLEENNISKKVTGAKSDNMGGLLLGKNPF